MSVCFGFSDFTASIYLERLQPCLKVALHTQEAMKSTLFTNQSQFDKVFAGIEYLVIDVTEIFLERTVNQQVQEESCSGRKTIHPQMAPDLYLEWTISMGQ